MKRERLTPKKSGPRYIGTGINEPHWLRKCELAFLRTGKLNLSNVAEPDLSLIKTRSTLKELNISRSKLTSLEGLAYQPNINLFNADSSQLSSMKNFSSIARASMYVLKGTPLSKQPNYLIGLIILSEEKIIVDGKHVANHWYKKAEGYPSFTRNLLNAGWKIEYPCPSNEVLREVCRQFNVEYVEDSDQDPVINMNYNQYDEEEEPANYLELIDMLMNRHNECINEASRNFKLLDMTDETFAQEIRDLLESRRHTIFQDDGDIDLQIVTAVRQLCIHRNPNPST